MLARRIVLSVACLCTMAVLAGGPAAAGGPTTKPVPKLSGVQPLGSPSVSAHTPRVSRAVGPNVNVSRMTNNQTETTLGINPTNPNNIVIVSNIDVGDGLFKAYSMNGGTTWTKEIIADGDNLGRACCDGSLAFDSFGNLFLTYLYATSGGVPVARSTNGGASFQFLGNATSGSADQPTIATGPGSVWVTWNQGGSMKARGAQVTGLGTIGTVGPIQSLPNASGSFGDIAVGQNGQVFDVYQSPTGGQGPATIYGNLDPDGLGPQGFGARITITGTNVGGFDFLPVQSGRSVDAEADLSFDRTNGTHRGRLYMVYTEEIPNESNDMDIRLRYSDNNGSTWSAPVQVNDDTGTRSQILPKLGLDPTTGYLAIGWHDARNDAGNNGPGDTNGIPNDDTQFWGTVSKDGGATFLPNVQISAGTSNDNDANNGIDYGDYIGLDYYAGSFFPAWADNSNSTGDNPNGTLHQFDVYTAKVTL